MFNLKIGDNHIKFNLPDRNIQLIQHIDPEKKVTPKNFASKLQKSLNQYDLKKKKILIVISDKTRKCGYDIYLPVLEKFLIESNVKEIRFIIAYGTHKQQSYDENLVVYGEIFNRYNFIHPDNEPKMYKYIGNTKRNTHVKVRKEIFDVDVIITFGAISHHYFAGYGGGRKLLFPGLGEKNAIYHNHSLFLDKEKKCLHRECRSGNLSGNPIAEDLKEIASLLPSRISIYGILNADGEICNLEIGNSYNDFKKICAKYDQYYMVKNDKLYDIIIASCGGFPKDINFIQSHKAVHNAASFVKNKGTLILFAECRDGIGSDTFLPYFKMGYEKAFNELTIKYEGNGGTALCMMEKTKRIKILLITKLSNELCKQIGVEKITESQIQKIIATIPGQIAIIENAGLIVKK